MLYVQRTFYVSSSKKYILISVSCSRPELLLSVLKLCMTHIIISMCIFSCFYAVGFAICEKVKFWPTKKNQDGFSASQYQWSSQKINKIFNEKFQVYVYWVLIKMKNRSDGSLLLNRKLFSDMKWIHIFPKMLYGRW